MTLILETWRTFVMHREVVLEDRITAVFKEALTDAYDRKGWPWTILYEGQITDPISGIQKGRNDLRFLHHKLHQRCFFTVECKRLHVTTPSGFNPLDKEYVEEGLLRFVEGKYAEGRPCAGMVGYVMNNDVPAAFQRLSKRIAAEKVNLHIKGTPHLHCPSKLLPNCQYSADTRHLRSGNDFIVHHLLVGVKR